jgi:excisionase family DNA binding protein
MSESRADLEDILREILMRIQDREYLTVSEAADFLRLDEQTVRNKIAKGVFKRGLHYFKRRGEIGIRFKRSALRAWLEGEEKKPATVLPMARGYELREGESSLTSFKQKG